LKKFATLLEEHWKGDIDLKQAVNLYKEHKVPDKFAKDLMLHGLSIALDKSGKSRPSTSTALIDPLLVSSRCGTREANQVTQQLEGRERYQRKYSSGHFQIAL
jgi:hypothetical protein